MAKTKKSAAKKIAKFLIFKSENAVIKDLLKCTLSVIAKHEELRYESSTLILFKELSSSIFQSPE